MAQFALVTAAGKIKTIIEAERSVIDELFYGDCFVELPPKVDNQYSPDTGDVYDRDAKEFKPYPSWVKSGENWIAPVPYPSEPYTQSFHWDEAQKAWVADHV